MWLFVLPSEQYSKHTYISESSLLPGQVNTYFSWGEVTAVTTYRNELENVLATDGHYDYVETELRRSGITVARQSFGNKTNVYGILSAPRADGTEALVLSASWITRDGKERNTQAVATLLALARYFKKYSLWSKDIIFLVADGRIEGVQAWIDAYHHDKQVDAPLSLKSGLIQGAVCIDYPGSGGFSHLEIFFEGVNGQLPNLDLINTAVHIGRHQIGLPVKLHQDIPMPRGSNDGKYAQYFESLSTMGSQMLYQALGTPSGPHGVFGRYKIDAITLHMDIDQSAGHNAFHAGRLIESVFRSLNNLLEHFHQSFFFYLLPSASRYVSIGLYLPVPLLIAAALVLQAVDLWEQTGDIAELNEKGEEKVIPRYMARPRRIMFPLLIQLTMHACGLILYMIVSKSATLAAVFGYSDQFLFVAFSTTVIYAIVHMLLMIAVHTRSIDGNIISEANAEVVNPNTLPAPDWMTLKCFALANAGVVISTLATINFSLAVAVCALVGVPFAVFRPASNSSISKLSTTMQVAVLWAISPIGLVFIVGHFTKVQPHEILEAVLSDHHVLGSWLVPFACCVYTPLVLMYFVIVASPRR